MELLEFCEQQCRNGQNLVAVVEIDFGTEDYENVFGGNTKGRTLWFGRCKSWFES